MFRKMRRFKQELEHEECVRILKEQKRGVLSLLGDDGYPYGIPIDYWYSEEDNKLYFHGAGEGHKMDAIKNCDKASFCVYDDGYRKDSEWALNISSVIVFGRMAVVDNRDKILEVCTNLCLKFTDDKEYIEQEIKRSGSRVCCLALSVEYMTGKIVNES